MIITSLLIYEHEFIVQPLLWQCSVPYGTLRCAKHVSSPRPPPTKSMHEQDNIAFDIAKYVYKRQIIWKRHTAAELTNCVICTEKFTHTHNMIYYIVMMCSVKAALIC